mmetsp:Transcript_18134/g.34882  ORF Transcript_18134/g.34882 Transcript_18134/m.34882 type:complete len:92 (+) Transcript_18134:1208-1483(+)
MPSAARIMLDFSQAGHADEPGCCSASAPGLSRKWSSDARREEIVPRVVPTTQGKRATSKKLAGALARLTEFFIERTVFIYCRSSTADLEFD